MAEPHVRTEVHPTPDGPIVVRSALDDIGRAVLAQEAERLERGRHPGVVDLLTVAPDRITLAWAGGQTLATARPGVAAAAGILAAVAGTVADLHRLGVVHGRLDPSHVILGPDGRPRLCGLRGPGLGERTAGPADDVAALGALVDHLVGPDAELEPIPDRRWGRRRWSGYQRRALQTIADRATDPDPAHRPTAGELARAIAEAVPEATLDPPAPAPVPEPVVAPPPTVPLPSNEPPPPTAPPLPRRVPTTATPRTPPVPAALPVHQPTPSPSPSAAAVGTAPVPDDADRPSGRSVLRVAAAATIVAGVLGAVSWIRPPSRTAVDDRPSPTAAAPATGRPAPVEITTTTATCTPVEGATSDLDGDGCPDLYRIDGTDVRALGRTFEVGRRGDHVQVGDWDCDGRATIAVVRPSTGEVFVFGGWNPSGPPVTVRAADVVPGATSLHAGSGSSCVVVAVGPGDTRTPLDLRGEGA